MSTATSKKGYLATGLVTSRHSRIIGVDPGLKGAISYIERDPDGNPVDIRVIDIISKYYAGMNLVDIDAMLCIMRMWPVSDFALLEMPFRNKLTYVNFGRLHAIIERCSNQWGQIESKIWKRKFLLTEDKSLSTEAAIQIFTSWGHLIKRKGKRSNKDDDNRAESLLLNEYAYRYLWPLEYE